MIRLFRIFVPLGVLTLLLSEIVLIASSYIASAYLVFNYDPTVFLLYDRGLIRIGIVVVSILVGFHFKDLYTNITVTSKARLLEDLCVVISLATIGQGVLLYFVQGIAVPQRMMMLGGAISITALFFYRQFHSAYVMQVGEQRILFIGCNPVVQEIAAYLRDHRELGMRVEGCLHNSVPAGNSVEGVPVLGPIESLRQIANTQKPDLIVVGLSERRDRMPVQDLLELRFAGFRIEEAGSTYETVCGRICTKELRPAQLIFTSELGPGAYGRRLQPLLDILVAVVGTIVTAPIMLLTALAVKFSSPGPVFYKQVRTGLEGAPFTVFKFRSMYTNAEARTGAVWASKDDPRITRVGKWLRRLRLDELPQFFNVLRGEMAIIGPRPERPEFVQTLSQQIPYYRQRLCVRPGVSGWAQINHKYGDTVEDTITKLEYDLYYIKHMSLSLDLYIIMHTLKPCCCREARNSHAAADNARAFHNGRDTRDVDAALSRCSARRRRPHLRLRDRNASELIHPFRGTSLPECRRSRQDGPHDSPDMRTGASGIRPRADTRLWSGLAHAAVEGIDVRRS